MSYLDNERLQATRSGMPGHAVYRWLVRKLSAGEWDDAASVATTYCVLRKHGMTVAEAWALKDQGVGARYAWHGLPPERLSQYDRIWLAATASAIDVTIRENRRRRKHQNKQIHAPTDHS